MRSQCGEVGERTNTQCTDFAIKPKTTRRRSAIGVAVLILFVWLLFAYLLYLSRGSLANACFWAAFIGFMTMFLALALSGDPDPSTPEERRIYPLHLSRRQHFVIGIVGLIVLFVFVIVLNSPVDKSLKWDIFYGGTTGGLAALAMSGTYLEFIRGSKRAK